eukprot:scaffold15837_cov99-Isochrysis_galbana.AAC.3
MCAGSRTRHSVGGAPVALHLSEPQPAVARAPLHRLAREQRDRPAGARVDLVVDHVLEPLVVGGAQENGRLEPPARVAVEHDLEATLLVAEVLEELGDVVDGHRGKGRRVALVAGERRNLGQEALDQVADGHARRDGVRVDDDVRRDALAGKGHILLPVSDADSALLPVPRGKLVADLRDAYRPDAHLDKLPALCVGREQDLINVAGLGRPERRRGIAFFIARGRGILQLLSRGLDWRRLPDDDVVPRDARARRYQPVLVELGVVCLAQPLHRLALGALELLGAASSPPPLAGEKDRLLFVAVRPVEDGPEEAAVDG